MNAYKMDFATKTLTITKAFAEAAANPNSSEYQLLMQFQRDFTGLTIAMKTHKSPSKYRTKDGETYRCNQFNNLTYTNMERFMEALPDSEKYLNVYKTLRDELGQVQTNTYTAVRRWFAAQFPKYRNDPLFYMENVVKVIDINTLAQETEKKEA